MKLQRIGLYGVLVAAACAALSLPARAENYEILQESLQPTRQGYTVLRVWGTHREMGRAFGRAFAQELDAFMPTLRAKPGYSKVRTLVANATWPAYLEEEIAGIVEGIQAGVPGSSVDAEDVKALNSFSDWSYGIACRSHSAWGDLVQPPVKTLSTRRLDFETPFSLALHHVVVAFEPSDGSVPWVNVGWPGVVTAITAGNAHGTQVSLHDYNSSTVGGSGLTFRSVAARRALTEPAATGADGQRDQAQNLLAGIRTATGSFINFFAPEGAGGVFTCSPGGGCGSPRRPQSDYFGGQVLITANAQTSGHSAPSGAEFLDSYYRQGGAKTLADHFGVMGTSGLHLVSTAYRGEGDMTLWVHGRGRSDHLSLEWSDLFPGTGPAQPDAGTPDPAGPDAGPGDPLAGDDAGTPPQAGEDASTPLPGTPGEDASADPGTTTPGPDAGSPGSDLSPEAPPGGCGTSGAPFAGLALLSIAAVGVSSRRRRAFARG